MSGLPWLPLNVRDYIVDTQHLTIAESGVYLHLLMNMWINDGYLPNDPRRLSAICKISIEEWDRLSPSVLSLCRLSKRGWTQKRLLQELARCTKQHEKRRAAGKRGGMAKALNAKEKEVKQCYSEAVPLTLTLTPIQIKEESKEDSPLRPPPHDRQPEVAKEAAAPVGAKKRSTRVDASIPISESGRAYARSRGMPSSGIDDEFQGFLDYHAAKGSLMSDWEAAWRTWVRNAEKFGAGRANGQPRIRSKTQEIRELMQEHFGNESEFVRPYADDGMSSNVSVLRR